MKKLILNILVFIGFFSVSFSQDGLVVKVSNVGTTGNMTNTNDNEDYSSGHTPFILNVTEENDYIIDFEVYNNSSDSMKLKVKITRSNTTPTSWSNAYCFGTSCYPSPLSFPFCSESRILNIPAGAHKTLAFHILTDVMGTGSYELFLGNDCNTAIDSVSINGSYTASIEETKQIPTFSMHPNPANDLVTINTNSNEKASLKMVDLLGNVVFTDSFIGSTSVNTNDFKNGVYFVTTEVNGTRYSNRKLLIRH